MAANTCNSTNGTVTGTDPTFYLTKSVTNRKDGAYLFLKYTLGTSTSLTLTFTTKSLRTSLTSTDAYSIVQLSGATISALTYTLTAAGNYKIPIPLSIHDDTLVITIVFSSAGVDGVVVANILDA